jgi:hypothetical protein
MCAMGILDSDYWSLEQIRWWARVHDNALRLWSASGEPFPEPTEVEPGIYRLARKRSWTPLPFDFPTNEDEETHWPDWPQWVALAKACGGVRTANRMLKEVILPNAEGEVEGPAFEIDGEKLQTFPAKFSSLIKDVFATQDRRGEPRVFRYPEFPIAEYLLRLFRSGDLKAFGNRPNDPTAHEISPLDWSGLEIAMGGNPPRLSVWLAGEVEDVGAGVLVNIRVDRETFLRAIPIMRAADVIPTAVTPEVSGRDLRGRRGVVRKEPKKKSAIAKELRRRFPGGPPPLTNPDLLRELEASAQASLGSFSMRTLLRAKKDAWPAQMPKHAK